jgi:hypothetical protein
MEERHIALNISEELENSFSKWEIKDKFTTVIIDNAKNAVNVGQLLFCIRNANISDVICTAYNFVYIKH